MKRNLPSWLSGKDNGSQYDGKKPTGSSENEESNESDKPKQVKGYGKGHMHSGHSKESKKTEGSCSSSTGSVTKDFSNLLEGVVFVLSGFVNPERNTLRSHALEMGAEYQPDWNSDCTLLICAFPNTPKFRQVEADCGTIVSKEWISECYAQKKLMEIERYLLHAGKPWRKSIPHGTNLDQKVSPSIKPQKPVKTVSDSKLNNQAIAKPSKAFNPARESFSPSKVKKWAIDDLHNTISWLESQEEKPGLDEIKEIAAEGILTCLQDAIDSLEQKQDIRQITEQWKFSPRVVEELAKLDETGNNLNSMSRANLCKQAVKCKRIYEVEFNNLSENSHSRKKNPSTREEQECKSEMPGDAETMGYESDETIEMTEEEIDLAFKTVASSKCVNA